MVAAAFDHWDSRASDPNLHTHVVVANKVQGPDGAWRSPGRQDVHAADVTVSELYDALLADEVARRLRCDVVDARPRGASQPGLRDRRRRRRPAGRVLCAVGADPLRGAAVGRGVR